MRESYPNTKYIDRTVTENKISYALFDCFIKDNMFMSEDWGFCERWQDIGGEVFADKSIKLEHIGPNNYKGDFSSFLNIKEK